MTISEIKAANKRAGFYFFERATLRFFRSRIERAVYEGPGGVYFVTSEQFVGSEYTAPRMWTVRKFWPETGDCETAGKFNELPREDAMKIARALAHNAATCPVLSGKALESWEEAKAV